MFDFQFIYWKEGIFCSIPRRLEQKIKMALTSMCERKKVTRHSVNSATASLVRIRILEYLKKQEIEFTLEM